MTTYTGTDGLTYNYNSSEHSLAVTGAGAMSSLKQGVLYLSDGTTTVDMKDITSLTISEGITQIGVYSCYQTHVAGTVTIPSTVMTIGEGAFVNLGGINAFIFKGQPTSLGNDSLRTRT